MAALNGRVPDAVLTTTSGGKRLWTPAAEGYERTSAAFRARFGKPLAFGAGWTGYRPVEIQQLLFGQLGYPAAAYPGTSNHGLGLAGDFSSGVQVYGSPEWRWMNAFGRTHGWAPLNERNLTFEPWHWVYDLARDQHRYARPDVPVVVTPPAPAPAAPTTPDLDLEDAMRLARRAATGEIVLVTPCDIRPLSFAQYTVMRGVIGKDSVDLSDTEWGALHDVIGGVIVATAANLKGQGL